MPTPEHETEQFEIRAARPIVFSLTRMRAAVAMILLAIVVCASVAAFVGFVIAEHRVDAQIAQQNASRAANRAAIQKAQAANVAQTEQQRQVICLLLQRATPDAEITRWRMAYKCGPVISGPSQPATTSGTSTSGPKPRGTQPPAPRPTPGAPVPTPKPKPTPSPTPPPSPTSGGLVCVLDFCLL